MTQCERILRHLNDYGSITSLEAMTEYGIMRLASRISDLRGLAILSNESLRPPRTGTTRRLHTADTEWGRSNGIGEF